MYRCRSHTYQDERDLQVGYQMLLLVHTCFMAHRLETTPYEAQRSAGPLVTNRLMRNLVLVFILIIRLKKSYSSRGTE